MKKLIILVCLLMVGCHQKTMDTRPPKHEEAKPDSLPEQRIPLMHGIRPRGDWEFTDPGFAQWIESHCYAVPASDLGSLSKGAMALKCKPDVHGAPYY